MNATLRATTKRTGLACLTTGVQGGEYFLRASRHDADE